MKRALRCRLVRHRSHGRVTCAGWEWSLVPWKRRVGLKADLEGSCEQAKIWVKWKGEGRLALTGRRLDGFKADAVEVHASWPT